MNKNELVHLHALLAQVAEEYADEGLATRDDFAAYHELGTTPMALRRSRADHEAATRALARTLARLSTDEIRGSDRELEESPAV
ncbi:UPF0058 family protein [Salinigranum salinum]|uniref:UPF0058 family protein n=1 Tax=Salinigranum salinum TaxID=1364937 RepID=UPI001864C8CF|nr:UPF0058 family protein [Salinigranum salinum]